MKQNLVEGFWIVYQPVMLKQGQIQIDATINIQSLVVASNNSSSLQTNTTLQVNNIQVEQQSNNTIQQVNNTIVQPVNNTTSQISNNSSPQITNNTIPQITNNISLQIPNNTAPQINNITSQILNNTSPQISNNTQVQQPNNTSVLQSNNSYVEQQNMTAVVQQANNTQQQQNNTQPPIQANQTVQQPVNNTPQSNNNSIQQPNTQIQQQTNNTQQQQPSNTDNNSQNNTQSNQQSNTNQQQNTSQTIIQPIINNQQQQAAQTNPPQTQPQQQTQQVIQNQSASNTSAQQNMSQQNTNQQIQQNSPIQQQSEQTSLYIPLIIGMVVSSLLTALCIFIYKCLKKKYSSKYQVESKYGNDPNEINKLIKDKQNDQKQENVFQLKEQNSKSSVNAFANINESVENKLLSNKYQNSQYNVSQQINLDLNNENCFDIQIDQLDLEQNYSQLIDQNNFTQRTELQKISVIECIEKKISEFSSKKSSSYIKNKQDLDQFSQSACEEIIIKNSTVSKSMLLTNENGPTDYRNRSISNYKVTDNQELIIIDRSNIFQSIEKISTINEKKEENMQKLSINNPFENSPKNNIIQDKLINFKRLEEVLNENIDKEQPIIFKQQEIISIKSLQSIKLQQYINIQSEQYNDDIQIKCDQQEIQNIQDTKNKIVNENINKQNTIANYEDKNIINIEIQNTIENEQLQIDNTIQKLNNQFESPGQNIYFDESIQQQNQSIFDEPIQLIDEEPTQKVNDKNEQQLLRNYDTELDKIDQNQQRKIMLNKEIKFIEQELSREINQTDINIGSRKTASQILLKEIFNHQRMSSFMKNSKQDIDKSPSVESRSIKENKLKNEIQFEQKEQIHKKHQEFLIKSKLNSSRKSQKSIYSPSNDPYSMSSMTKDLIHSYDWRNLSQKNKVKKQLFDISKLEKKEQHIALKNEVKQFSKKKKSKKRKNEQQLECDRIGSATSRYLSQKGNIQPIILETEESLKESKEYNISSQKQSQIHDSQNNQLIYSNRQNNNLIANQIKSKQILMTESVEKLQKINTFDQQMLTQQISKKDLKFAFQDSLQSNQKNIIISDQLNSPELFNSSKYNNYQLFNNLNKEQYQEGQKLNFKENKSQTFNVNFSPELDLDKDKKIKTRQKQADDFQYEDILKSIEYSKTNRDSTQKQQIEKQNSFQLKMDEILTQKEQNSGEKKIFKQSFALSSKDKWDALSNARIQEHPTPYLGKHQKLHHTNKKDHHMKIKKESSHFSEEISPYIGVSQQNNSFISLRKSQEINNDQLMEDSLDQRVKELYTEGNYINEFIQQYQKEIIEKPESSKTKNQVNFQQGICLTNNRDIYADKSIDFDLEKYIDQMESKSANNNSNSLNQNNQNILKTQPNLIYSYSKQFSFVSKLDDLKTQSIEEQIESQILADYEQQILRKSQNLKQPQINVLPNQSMYQKDISLIGLSQIKPVPQLNIQKIDIRDLKLKNDNEINKVQAQLNQYIIDSQRRRKNILDSDSYSQVQSIKQLDKQVSIMNDNNQLLNISSKKIEQAEMETNKLKNIYSNIKKISEKKKKKRNKTIDSMISDEIDNHRSLLKLNKTPRPTCIINDYDQQSEDIQQPFTPNNYMNQGTILDRNESEKKIINVEKQIAEKFGFKYLVNRNEFIQINQNNLIEKESVCETINQASSIYTPAHTIYKKRGNKKKEMKIEMNRNQDHNKSEYSNKMGQAYYKFINGNNGSQKNSNYQNDLFRPQTQEQGDQLKKKKIKKKKKNNLFKFEEPNSFIKLEDKIKQILNEDQNKNIYNGNIKEEINLDKDEEQNKQIINQQQNEIQQKEFEKEIDKLEKEYAIFNQDSFAQL